MKTNQIHIDCSVYRLKFMFCLFFLLCFTKGNAQHLITFCDYVVPLQNDFVRDKMVNVIKKQVRYVNMPALRERANTYMPIVEKYLKAYGLHSDLKYIPIVESGFLSKAESPVGARGIWQIMPATAKGYGLSIAPGNDERENFDKATRVACQLIRDNYKGLYRIHGFTNWPLSIAAYNFGIGNVSKAIKRQGSNYFTMKLNAETGLYVYKIIAVKELFEYPEIYNSKYGYNIFNPSKRKKKPSNTEISEEDILEDIQNEVVKNINKKAPEIAKKEYIPAHIEGKYKRFKDGDMVTIVLDDDLKTEKDGLSFSGYSFGIQGWIIDGRVTFNLGFGHDVTLMDLDLNKGVDLSILKSNKRIDVLLKNIVYK